MMKFSTIKPVQRLEGGKPPTGEPQ